MQMIKAIARNIYVRQASCLLFAFIIVSICAFFAIDFFNQYTPAIYTSEDRITHVITWLNLPAMTLVLGLYMKLSWEQTYGDHPEQDKKQRVLYVDYLSNTTQQLFAFALALLQFCLFIPENLLGLVPLFCVLFCLSRLFYIIGLAIFPIMKNLGSYLALFLSIIMLIYGFKLLVNWGTLLNAPF